MSKTFPMRLSKTKSFHSHTNQNRNLFYDFKSHADTFKMFSSPHKIDASENTGNEHRKKVARNWNSVAKLLIEKMFGLADKSICYGKIDQCCRWSEFIHIHTKVHVSHKNKKKNNLEICEMNRENQRYPIWRYSPVVMRSLIFPIPICIVCICGYVVCISTSKHK